MTAVRQLRVLPGERRGERRRASGAEAQLYRLEVGGLDLTMVRWIGLEFGRISFALPSEQWPQSVQWPEALPLKLADNRGEILIAGPWQLIHQRQQEGEVILAFALPAAVSLRALRDYLPPSALLKPSYFRILSFIDASAAEEVSHLLTAIKDFPHPLPVKIMRGTEATTGVFDFSSMARQIGVIDIRVDQAFTDGEEVVVEFVLHATRYLFPTTVAGYEPDFSILSVTLPPAIIAVTTRKHQRWPCQLPVEVSWGDEAPVPAVATSLSPLGTQVHIETTASLAVGTPMQVRFSGHDLVLQGVLRDHNRGSMGIGFVPEHIPQVFKLFSAVVSGRYTVRDPSNYRPFLQLYQAVGYGPHPEQSVATWESLTTAAWQIQDRELPGNTLGIIAEGILHGATGNLPLSDQCVYSHSLAMRQTIHSVNSLCDGNAYNLAWMEFVPGTEYFAGSAKKSSRLSPRLHLSFATGTGPAQMIRSNCLAVSQLPIVPITGRFRFVQTQNLTETYPANSPHWKVMAKILRPHPKLAAQHSISSFLIYEGDTLLGAVVSHQAPPLFTAANLLNLSWVFVDSPLLAPEQLLHEIYQHPIMGRREIDLFMPTDAALAELGALDCGDEVLWYFVGKDELGPLLSSVSRVALAVMRKYGEKAVAELTRQSL